MTAATFFAVQTPPSSGGPAPAAARGSPASGSETSRRSPASGLRARAGRSGCSHQQLLDPAPDEAGQLRHLAAPPPAARSPGQQGKLAGDRRAGHGNALPPPGKRLPATNDPPVRSFRSGAKWASPAPVIRPRVARTAPIASNAVASTTSGGNGPTPFRCCRAPMRPPIWRQAISSCWRCRRIWSAGTTTTCGPSNAPTRPTWIRHERHRAVRCCVLARLPAVPPWRDGPRDRLVRPRPATAGGREPTAPSKATCSSPSCEQQHRRRRLGGCLRIPRRGAADDRRTLRRRRSGRLRPSPAGPDTLSDKGGVEEGLALLDEVMVAVDRRASCRC